MDKEEAGVGGGRQRSCHAKELGFSSVDFWKAVEESMSRAH